MKNHALKSLSAAGFALAFALFASSAEAARSVPSKADYGTVSPASTADYVVTIGQSTKWVNVNDGDTVRFSANGKQFTFHFDTFDNDRIVKLADIAPPGVNVGAVKVYVGLNPIYRN